VFDGAADDVQDREERGRLLDALIIAGKLHPLQAHASQRPQVGEQGVEAAEPIRPYPTHLGLRQHGEQDSSCLRTRVARG
jgi:hypothetical protein